MTYPYPYGWYYPNYNQYPYWYPYTPQYWQRPYYLMYNPAMWQTYPSNYQYPPQYYPQQGYYPPQQQGPSLGTDICGILGFGGLRWLALRGLTGR